MPEIHVTENGVLKLLKALNILQSCWSRWYQTKSAQIIILRISTYPYTAFQCISAPTSLPDIWNYANVSPFYKKGDEKTPSNYRPMSLTCISCKLLEHIISNNLMPHLKRNKVLYPLQHGFRGKRSFEIQLV